jgi:hypothetical protein
MDRHDETKAAIINRLRELNAEPSKPISIYEIGVPLVKAQFTEDEIMYALFALESEKTIELMGDNRLRLLKPLV